MIGKGEPVIVASHAVASLRQPDAGIGELHLDAAPFELGSQQGVWQTDDQGVDERALDHIQTFEDLLGHDPGKKVGALCSLIGAVADYAPTLTIEYIRNIDCIGHRVLRLYERWAKRSNAVARRTQIRR